MGCHVYSCIFLGEKYVPYYYTSTLEDNHVLQLVMWNESNLSLPPSLVSVNSKVNTFVSLVKQSNQEFVYTTTYFITPSL